MWKPRERHQLTRQELYDLVWAEPVYKVADKFGTSGVALGKRCRKAHIPLPTRGYWACLQFGKKTKKTRLKPAPPGVSETVIIMQGTGPREPAPPKPELDRQIVKAIEAEQLDRNKIVVSATVTQLHPMAKRVAANTDKRPWKERNEKHGTLEMRRRILHAFFRAVEQRKGEVSAAGDVGFDVDILGSTFKLSCSEVIRKVRVPMTKEQLKKRSEWDRSDYITVQESTGLLRLRMNRGEPGHKDFVDTDDAPLETKLNDAMIWLFQRSITVTERERRAEEARVAAAARARVAHEAEMARWKAEDLRRKEKERVENLLGKVQQWRKAEELRAYVRCATEALDVTDDWKTWALKVADSLDPLVSERRRLSNSSSERDS